MKPTEGNSMHIVNKIVDAIKDVMSQVTINLAKG